MKTKTKKPTKRKVNGALGVRKEVAAKFSAFCRSRGWEIATMAEQALSQWMREQNRKESHSAMDKGW